MCPSDYRPKQGNSEVDRVLHDFLTMQVARQEQLLAQKEAPFAKERSREKKILLKLQVRVSQHTSGLGLRVLYAILIVGTPTIVARIASGTPSPLKGV